MVGLVKDSALLTEEDCQVLNFVLSESGTTRSKIEKQHSRDDWSTSHVWYWAVLIGLVAVAVVLAPIGWVWCGGVTVVTCVMLVTVIMVKNILEFDISLYCFLVLFSAHTLSQPHSHTLTHSLTSIHTHTLTSIHTHTHTH